MDGGTVRERLGSTLWRDLDVLRALLGDTFSTPQAKAVADSLTGDDMHISNVRRKLSGIPEIEVDIDEIRGSRTSSGRGRPSTVWDWRA